MYISGILFLMGTFFIHAQNTIAVEINNFESDRGVVLVGLYNSTTTFMEKEYKGEILKIKDKQVVLNFSDLPDGSYAILVVHDEDENGELSTNFIGIPKEKYGASNNAPSKFGPPKWKDAKFEVKNRQVVSQKIAL